jgi:hypothetical protein
VKEENGVSKILETMSDLKKVFQDFPEDYRGPKLEIVTRNTIPWKISCELEQKKDRLSFGMRQFSYGVR